MPEKKCPPEGLPGWMGTYGDMMTLLLCFFVLLFAFSTLDAQKFTTLMEAFQGSFGVIEGGKTISPEQLLTNSRIQSKGRDMKFKKMAKELQEKIEQIIQEQQNENEKAEDIAQVKTTERGIEISLGDRTLFDTGKAELKPRAQDILDQIYDKLRGIPNEIIVEGHTDNVPINTTKYPSNWELSTARSTNVLKYLIRRDNSLVGRISASGYADTKPVAVNTTSDGRRKNRRVDIVILKSIDDRVDEKVEEKVEEKLNEIIKDNKIVEDIIEKDNRKNN